MKKLLIVSAALLSLCLPLRADQVPSQVVGYLSIPAEHYHVGPPSGRYYNETRYETPRFRSQPMKGFSGLISSHNPRETFMTITDRGFESRYGSRDFFLRAYELQLNPRVEPDQNDTFQVRSYLQFSDPRRLLPFRIETETTYDRFLTGADFSPSALASDPRGGYWVADQYGPYLLGFDLTGKLRHPPVVLPMSTDEGIVPMISPDHPVLTERQQTGPNTSWESNIPEDTGVGAMSLAASRDRIFVLMNTTVGEDQSSLRRLLQFDFNTQRFSDRYFFYPLENENHHVDSMTTVNDDEFLVLESDGKRGEEAQFRRLYLVDRSLAGDDRRMSKELLVDFLNVSDPRNLARQGSTFRMPYRHLSGILILDPDTILVTHDNEILEPGVKSAGDEPDRTEFVWIRLVQPLNLP